MSMWRKTIDEIDPRDVRALEARVTELEKTVERIILDLAYVMPSALSSDEVTLDTQEKKDRKTEDINAVRSTLDNLKSLSVIPVELIDEDDLNEACRLASNVTHVKKLREWRPKKGHGAPVESQMAAWFAINLNDVLRYDFSSAEFADCLIRLAENTDPMINWALKENDRRAIGFMGLAWDMVPKTLKPLDTDVPF